MNSKRHKHVLRAVIWNALLFGLMVAGCQYVVPRQGWNSAKWGPVVPHKNFPGDCSICHAADRWDKLRDDFKFDHEKETGFKLEGAHAEAACLRCHNDRGPVQAYVARGCAGCHVNPHADSLGMDCQRCHDEISWKPQGLIAQHARTRFPLTGVHAVTACDSCHKGAPSGDFRGAPEECSACHQSDLARATNPDHAAAGWTSDCQRCHTPAGWGGASFNHDFFPLTGGHAGLECAECHADGVFSGRSADCYSCHETDFKRALNHVSFQYPHDCTMCHTTEAWTPSTFIHSFPLTGGHDVSCVNCHTTDDFGTFSCLVCHIQFVTDDRHSDVPNYKYESQACYQCHPKGEL